jgi:RNA polymerase sigma-70 factor (ECF subfamily)
MRSDIRDSGHANAEMCVPALADYVAQMAVGNQDGLAGLYDELGASVYGTALAILRNPADAEEVAADVFWKAWHDAPRYDPQRGSVQAWVITMTKSRAIDKLRARRVRPSGSLIEASQLVDRSPSPEQLLESTTRQARLWHQVMELPAPLRSVVELAWTKGLTHSQLAVELGLPLGTVKTRMRTGLQVLRLQLAN